MFNAFILSILFFASSAIYSPGVVYEIETTDHSSGEVHSTEMCVEGKLLKMGIQPSENGKGTGEMIFNGDKKEVVVVDHDSKTYMVIDEEFKAKIDKQLNDAQSEIMKALESLPQEQRDAIMKAQKKSGQGLPGMPGAAPKYTLKKTNEKATKNGYPCVKYIVFKDDKKHKSLWVTDWSNLTGGGEVKAAFLEMNDFIAESMESLTVPGYKESGPLSDMGGVYKHLTEANGFPVITREFDDKGDLESESGLKSTMHRTLDPAEFEPPAGYKRRSMMGGRY